MPNVFQPFKSFPFSKITLILAAFIIISAAFMRQAMNFVRAHPVGEKTFPIMLAVSGLVFILAFASHIVRKKGDIYKKVLFIVVLTLGVILAWQLQIPEERIHILEYGLLAFLANKDLVKPKLKYKPALFALGFVILVGILDEAFQAILPYRYYDQRDILFNALGGGYGVILHLLS